MLGRQDLPSAFWDLETPVSTWPPVKLPSLYPELHQYLPSVPTIERTCLYYADNIFQGSLIFHVVSHMPCFKDLT